MAFTVEDGNGVADANAYLSVADVRLHHSERGNDFFETIIVAATGVLTATGNPADADTVTIGSRTYTFQATLTNSNGNVQRGATQADSLGNLAKAINRTGVPGTDYAAAMVVNADVSAVATATTVTVTAKTKGESANSLTTTEVSTVLSWASATLIGGDESKARQVIIRASDYIDKRFGRRWRGERQSQAQGLTWPRLGAFDVDGFYITGLPKQIKRATAEYALRAALYNVLAPDPNRIAPTQNMATGTQAQAGVTGAVTAKKEKVGPIEIEEKYESVAALAAKNRDSNSRSFQSDLVNDFYIPEYPEADLWLEELTTSGSISRPFWRA